MSRPVVDVRDFGAIGDGRTPCSRAFAAAFEAIPVNGLPQHGTPTDGALVLIPPGDYLVEDTIEIRHKTGFVIQGAGPTQTRLRWAPPHPTTRAQAAIRSLKPLLRLVNCSLATLREFGLFALPAPQTVVDSLRTFEGLTRRSDGAPLSWREWAETAPAYRDRLPQVRQELVAALPWLGWTERGYQDPGAATGRTREWLEEANRDLEDSLRHLLWRLPWVTCDSAIVSHTAPGFGPPTNNHFFKINIDGHHLPQPAFLRGVRFTSAVVVRDGGRRNHDANNADMVFTDCLVRYCAEAGISFEHGQSKAHRLVACNVNGCRRGVTTALGGEVADYSRGQSPYGGSFLCFGGAITNNAVADFDLGAPNDAILISGVNSEDSGRLLRTVSGGGGPWPVLIQGVRFATRKLHRDGFVIRYENHSGPLVVLNSVFGAARRARRDPPLEDAEFDALVAAGRDPATADETVPHPRIRMVPAAPEDGVLVAVGNAFLDPDPFRIPPLDARDDPVNPKDRPLGSAVLLGNTWHDLRAAARGTAGQFGVVADRLESALLRLRDVSVGGSALFSSVGGGTVGAGADRATVPDRRVGPASHVTVTLAADPGPACRGVRWVEVWERGQPPGPAERGFTVVLDGAVAQATAFTYFVVDPLPGG